MLKLTLAYLTGNGLGSTLVRALMGSAGLRIIGLAMGFLVGVQLARSLGASGYGIYGLAMSLLSIAAIPAEFGLPQLVTREVAAAHQRQDRVLIGTLIRWSVRTLLCMALVALLIGTVLGWWRSALIDVSLLHALAAGFLFVVLAPLGNVFGAALRGLQQVVAGQVPDVLLRPAVYSALLFASTFLLSDGLSPALAMLLQVVSVGFSTACAYVYLRRHLPKEAMASRVRASSAQAQQWLRSTWPLALTEAMRVVHGNLATLTLGLLSTTTAVGVFRVGSSTSALLTMPISLFHIVLAPTIARLHAAGDDRRLEQLMGWSSAAMAVGVAVLCLPFVFAGGPLLAFMFGSDFIGANSTLLALGIGSAIGSLFGPGATLLNMTGHERRVTRSFAFSLLALCVLMPPLGYYLKGFGAALAVSLSFILWSAVMWWDAKRLLGIDASVLSLRRIRSRLKGAESAAAHLKKGL